MSISLEKIINGSATESFAGVPVPSLNHTALFSNESATFIEEYKRYYNSTDVEKAFGTNSKTATFARSLFSQSPNLVDADGSLLIIKMIDAVDASSGYTVTDDISTNVTNFATITNGSINIIIDGNVPQAILGLNFSQANTLAKIASVLQAKIANAVVLVVGNTIKFTSKKYGTSSNIEFTANTTGQDISVASLLDIAGMTIEDGVNATGETLVEAITRVGDAIQYYGVATTLRQDDTVLLASSNYLQSKMAQGWFTTKSTNDAKTGNLIDNHTTAQSNKSAIMIANTIDEMSLLGGTIGRFYTTSLNIQNSALSITFKRLNGVARDSGITDEVFDNCQANGGLIYTDVNYNNIPMVIDTNAVSRTYFRDYIYNADLLQIECNYAFFNGLAKSNSKVAQTESDMDSLKSFVVENVLSRAITANIIAPGAWNGEIPFGDDSTAFINSIAKFGYYIWSKPVSQQTQEDRVARKAPRVYIAVKFSGAIQFLQYSLVIEQ